MNDEEAIQLCQEGNRDAFRHLVEQYKDVLYGTAILMTGDTVLAEDMVQEGFISAWKGIRGFKTGQPVKPWLVKIVVNKVLDYRKRSRLPVIPFDEAATSSYASPELINDIDNQDQVRQAMNKLSEAHREVVILRYFAELSLAEISTATGCREGTVKSRLNRALEELRSCMEKGNT